MDYIFYPDNVAIIGAKEEGEYTESLVKFGKEPYLVNPNRDEVFGIKCYNNISEIEDDIDYAIIRTPAPLVPDILEDCIDAGIKAVHVFSSGFSETGIDERVELEEKIKEIAEGKIDLIGPNCMGIYCPESGLSFGGRSFGRADGEDRTGRVGFVSQSGTFAVELAEMDKPRNIPINKVISYGNAVDLDCSDFLKYLGNDPKTEIVGLYIEGTKNGKKLRNVLQDLTKKKPVIALKGGITEYGGRAATSHTASMAGSGEIWNSIFKQTNVIQVDSFDEFVDTIHTFLYSPLPSGDKVSIITNSGGFSVHESDQCARFGLKVPEFTEKTKNDLRDVIPVAGTSIRNPLDAWPAFTSEAITDALEIVASDKNIDSIILHLTRFYDRLKRHDSGMTAEELLNSMIDSCKYVKEKLEKPIIAAIPLNAYLEEGKRGSEIKVVRRFQDEELPVVPSISGSSKAISNLLEYNVNQKP